MQRLATALLTLVLAGCTGGTTSTFTTHAPQPAAPSAAPSLDPRVPSASITIRIGDAAAPASPSKRAPKLGPPPFAAFDLTVSSGGASMSYPNNAVSLGAPGCSTSAPLTCTLSFTVPIGNDTFAATAFDSTNLATRKPLRFVSTSAAITAAGPNTVNLSTLPLAASVTLPPVDAHPIVGATIPVTLSAVNAISSPIFGPIANPITLSGSASVQFSLTSCSSTTPTLTITDTTQAFYMCPLAASPTTMSATPGAFSGLTLTPGNASVSPESNYTVYVAYSGSNTLVSYDAAMGTQKSSVAPSPPLAGTYGSIAVNATGTSIAAVIGPATVLRWNVASGVINASSTSFSNPNSGNLTSVTCCDSGGNFVVLETSANGAAYHCYDLLPVSGGSWGSTYCFPPANAAGLAVKSGHAYTAIGGGQVLQVVDYTIGGSEVVGHAQTVPSNAVYSSVAVAGNLLCAVASNYTTVDIYTLPLSANQSPANAAGSTNGWGSSPWQCALDNNNQVYFDDFSNGAMSVFDVSTPASPVNTSAGGTFYFATRGTGFALSPSGGKMWGVGFGGTIAGMDTTTRSITASLSVGGNSGAQAIAIGP